jgi:hypothetical protein
MWALALLPRALGSLEPVWVILRTSVGVAPLPKCATVEIDLIAAVRDHEAVR